MPTRAEGAQRRAPPLLDVQGVSKSFGDLRVLDQVSLSVAVGEVVALVGDNGAGKSTLVKCIGRALGADAGQVLVDGRPLGPDHGAVAEAGVAVVWQDLSLCDNLDTVANLFLGRERRRLVLARAEMHAEARRMLARLDIEVPDLTRPVALLSGRQRQAIAVARALAGDPRLLVLDEPTAALGQADTGAVLALVRRLRREGTGVLLVTHQIEQAFDLADRIVVLRQGRVVAEVSPLEVHPDDVVALQLGIEADSTASRQLRRLGSLVEQLSEVEPAASLPLVVSAMAAAIGQDKMCVHLVEHRPGGPVLRRSAAVGLPEALLAATAELPLGPAGGPVGLAARTGATVVTEDVRTDPAWARFRPAAAEAGVQSSWAAAITGSRGVLGTITGYGDTVGRPRADQLELVALYARHAAASIEREWMYAEAQRRNRVLEAIRTVLEALAGPEQVHAGIEGALAALCRVLGAEGALVRVGSAGPEAGGRPARGGLSGTAGSAGAGGPATVGTAGDTGPAGGPGAGPSLAAAADAVLARGAAAEVAAGHMLAVPFAAPGGPAALAVRWRDAAGPEGAAEVLHDAARSLSLGLERQQLEASHREAQALRRSQRLQRDFLSRLSHELRTPLTAIHGCVDTLLQPDVAWAPDEQRRFLDTIGAESDRMRRLVADLLDVSAIDAGIFRIHPDWCDLALVLRASVACAAPGAPGRAQVDVDPALGPVWADHDRLEQVFVNLLENALRHAPEGTPVRVSVRPAGSGRTAEVRVSDDGEGVPPELTHTLFEPHVAGPAGGGTGLGLTIARGIVRAHGGSLTLEHTGPAGGATFLVALPVAPAGPGASSPARRPSGWPPPSRPGPTVGDPGPAATNVLLVEDDPNIVDLIRSNLLARGYAVDTSTTGEGVAARVADEPPDVVLLDLMLPALDGFELCRDIRERSSVGIIVVSARGREGDKVRALNLGADDYMTKPFGVEELLARITATLRRVRPAPEPLGPSVIEAGDVVVDLDARRVTKGDVRVHLTPTELALLRELVTHPRVLLPHAHLLRRVWGPGYETQTEYLRVYVRRLRAKLEGGGPPLIVTEPRLGYRFEPP